MSDVDGRADRSGSEPARRLEAMRLSPSFRCA